MSPFGRYPFASSASVGGTAADSASKTSSSSGVGAASSSGRSFAASTSSPLITARPSLAWTSASSGERATLTVMVTATSGRSEEHTSELQSLMRISYAVFYLKKKTTQTKAYRQLNRTI